MISRCAIMVVRIRAYRTYNNIDLKLPGLVDHLLTGDVPAKINDLKAVGRQHGLDDVLADIMDIALYSKD